VAYLILIPTSASENLKILMEQGIWGFDNTIASQIKLKPSAKILFAHAVRYAGDGKAPPGFPRLKSWDDIAIKIEKLFVTEVISGLKTDSSVFGERYPQVFKVKILNEIENVNKDELDSGIVELLRLSTTHSKPREIDSSIIDELTG